MAKSEFTLPIKEKKSSYRPIVPAVEQAIRILIHLGKSTKNKQTLTEICGHTGIHKSTVYSILNTLKQFGFIEKEPDSKTYSVGPGLVISARSFLVNLDQKEIVGPFLKKLAEETSSTALLCLINAEDQVYVAGKHEGNQDIGFTIRRGFTFHITHGAIGKSIVAFMQEPEREKILSGKKLYFYNREGNINSSRLKRELSLCRKNGFAEDPGEMHRGINSVSSPLFGPMEKMLGCILLIGNYQDALIREYGRKVSAAAREISYRLGADVSQIYETTK